MSRRPRASARQVLSYTSLLDLLRGDIPGRLDPRVAIAPFELPKSLENFVLHVADETHLRLKERIAVAEDLAEHMRDGLDLGMSEDKIRSNFGNEMMTAELIRRSMLRKRSQWARLPGSAIRGSLLLISCILVFALITWTYLGMHIWFASPKVTVNYIDSINEPLLGIPEEDRAWPSMQEASLQVRQLGLQQLGLTGNGVDAATTEDQTLADTYVDHLFGHTFNILTSESSGLWPDWPRFGMFKSSSGPDELRAFIRSLEARGVDPLIANTESPQAIDAFYERATPLLSELRELLQRPVLGYELKSNRPDAGFFEIAIADLFQARTILERLLVGDIVFALRKNDSPRVLLDIEALLNFARLGRTPSFVTSQNQSRLIQQSVFRTVLDILAMRPDFFDDRQLLELARILAVPDERIELSLEHERLFFEDIAQRFYSSSGQLLPDSFQFMRDHSFGEIPDGMDSAAIAPIALALAPTRTEALENWHGVMDHYEVSSRIHRGATPKITAIGVYDVYTNLYNPPILDDASIFTQYKEYITQFPLNTLMMPLNTLVEAVHQTKQERDATLIAIALEQWRRAHGAWPPTLDRLVPEYLAAVPIDQYDGQSLRYQLSKERPLIYSVGDDGNDDGGTPHPGPATWTGGADILLWQGPAMD